jgi:hypothetical protein
VAGVRKVVSIRENAGERPCRLVPVGGGCSRHVPAFQGPPLALRLVQNLVEMLVLPERIELSTSPFPRKQGPHLSGRPGWKLRARSGKLAMSTCPTVSMSAKMILEIWKCRFPWLTVISSGSGGNDFQQHRGNQANHHFHMFTISTPYGGPARPGHGRPAQAVAVRFQAGCGGEKPKLELDIQPNGLAIDNTPIDTRRGVSSARLQPFESPMSRSPEFDIALSFAGEDRAYVDQVAHILRDRGIKVFYDLFEEADFWGKDLYTHLTHVYQNRAKFTVIFISAAYDKKLWTNHERRAAQARAFQEAQEYILPARFDDTNIPGVLPTTGYVSLQNRSPDQLVSLITKKLVSSGRTVPSEFVRKDFSTIRTTPRLSPTLFSIRVTDDEGSPIQGCTVVAMADNATTLKADTGTDGTTLLSVQTRRNYRLLVAHPEFPAAIVERVDPSDAIEVTLQRTDNVGSLVIESTGYIPGLAGQLHPILDTTNRTYLCAENIAINGSAAQPAAFRVNEPFELEDANGVVTFVTVKLIAGRTSLLQYLRPNP